MAHVYQGSAVVAAGAVIHNVVAGDGLHLIAVVIGGGRGVGDIGLVALLAAAVADPLGNHGADGGITGVVHSGAGSGGVGVYLQGGNGGIQSLHRVDLIAYQALGICLGGSGLLGVGGIIIQVAAGAQIILVVAVGIVNGGVLGVLSFYLLVGVGQAVPVLGLIAAGQQIHTVVFLVAVQGCAVAVHGLQVGLGLGVAIDGSVQGQGGLQRIQLGLVAFAELVAVGSCLFGDGVGGPGALLGRAQEVICPGGACVGIKDLLVQSFGGVQAVQGGVGSVLGVEIVDGVDEIVA